MTILDFMCKHPIITFLIISDFFVTVENLVLHIAYEGKYTRSKRFNERISDSLDKGKEKIMDIVTEAKSKDKIEIGFHSSK